MEPRVATTAIDLSSSVSVYLSISVCLHIFLLQIAPWWSNPLSHSCIQWHCGCRIRYILQCIVSGCHSYVCPL